MKKKKALHRPGEGQCVDRPFTAQGRREAKKKTGTIPRVRGMARMGLGGQEVRGSGPYIGTVKGGGLEPNEEATRPGAGLGQPRGRAEKKRRGPGKGKDRNHRSNKSRSSRNSWLSNQESLQSGKTGAKKKTGNYRRKRKG